MVSGKYLPTVYWLVVSLFSLHQWEALAYSNSLWLKMIMPSHDHRNHPSTQRRAQVAAHMQRSTMTSTLSRARFLHERLVISSLILFLPNRGAQAFDGGVGGLGKSRPQTGVIFRDPTEAAAMVTQSKSGNVNFELIAPDGSPVFLSFFAPWPVSKSSSGIESRDISGGYESSFVQVAELPIGVPTIDKVNPEIIHRTIFGSTGKFGMYGTPTDVKINKLKESADGVAIYQAYFTALTPALRESERRAFITAAVVGNGLFLLVTSTTAARFRKQLDVLTQVAESFSAIPAPKTNLSRNTK